MNLPLLIFHQIHTKAQSLQSGKAGKNIVIPYSMWISHLLDLHNVITYTHLGMESKGEVKDDLLTQIGLIAEDKEEKVSGVEEKGDTGDGVQEGAAWRASVECLLELNVAKSEEIRIQMLKLTSYTKLLTDLAEGSLTGLKNDVTQVKDLLTSLVKSSVRELAQSLDTTTVRSDETAQPAPSREPAEPADSLAEQRPTTTSSNYILAPTYYPHV
ncbi:hypothetical protein RND81_03G106500 [Saponaria officinalis]|uniref:Uncharacterized protein n=1 Tax=Saponaria officinalis TaxID=3572 RepID=A0AAW1LZH6_SAPOF